MSKINKKQMKTKKTISKKILTNKLLPLILMGLNLYFFFNLIPIHIAEEYSMFLSITGGVITAFLSFYIFAIIIPELLNDMPVFLGIIGISTIFVFAYFFIKKTSHFASNEIFKNGIHREAEIIDKTQIYGKRGKSVQTINVSFLTENNKKATATINITEKYYNNLSEGMKIPIIYSSKHPNIAELDFNLLKDIMP
jgi:hypothetical protein